MESLLTRTAEAIYLTATADEDHSPPYASLTPKLHDYYERMAVAALTIAYREPLVDESCPN